MKRQYKADIKLLKQNRGALQQIVLMQLFGNLIRMLIRILRNEKTQHFWLIISIKKDDGMVQNRFC